MEAVESVASMSTTLVPTVDLSITRVETQLAAVRQRAASLASAHVEKIARRTGFPDRQTRPVKEDRNERMEKLDCGQVRPGVLSLRPGGGIHVGHRVANSIISFQRWKATINTLAKAGCLRGDATLDVPKTLIQ